MTPRPPMAHLRSSDRPQPVDSWSRDLTVVLWLIAALLLIAGVAQLLNPLVGPS